MRRRISRFSVKKFWSHSAQKIRGHHFNVSEVLGYRKTLWIIGGIAFLRRKFLSHSTKKFCWGTIWCFKKFRVSQNFMHKKGISLNSVENSVSDSANKVRRWTLLRFERILVLKNFQQRRRSFTVFSKVFFISRNRENCAREPFCVLKNFWREEVFMDKRGRGGGSVSRFSVGKFLSHCSEIFHCRTLWCFRKVPLSKNFLHRRRGHHGFAELFFVLQDGNEKLCKGTLLVSRKFLVLKEIYG